MFQYVYFWKTFEKDAKRKILCFWNILLTHETLLVAAIVVSTTIFSIALFSTFRNPFLFFWITCHTICLVLLHYGHSARDILTIILFLQVFSNSSWFVNFFLIRSITSLARSNCSLNSYCFWQDYLFTTLLPAFAISLLLLKSNLPIHWNFLSQFCLIFQNLFPLSEKSTSLKVLCAINLFLFPVG